MSAMTSSPADLPVLARWSAPTAPFVFLMRGSAAHAVRTSSSADPRPRNGYTSTLAFPDEPGFFPSPRCTSLFPHLSHRAKAPFRRWLLPFFLVLLLILAPWQAQTAPVDKLSSALSVPLRLLLSSIWKSIPRGQLPAAHLLCLLLGARTRSRLGDHRPAAMWTRLRPPSLHLSLISGSSIVAAIAVPAIGHSSCACDVIARRMQRGPIEYA